MVEQENLDGYFVHLDVDVLNDDLMPAVDSREKDGLSYSELNQLLSLLLNHEKARGLQITILDPDLDPTAIYTQEFISEVGTTIKKARKAFAAE
jgi:arginase